MANQTSFFQYLLAAFRYKRLHKDALSFKYLGLELPYDTEGPQKGIFYYSRNGKTALPKAYTNFPDTKEGNMQMVEKVLETIDKNTDQTLENYFNQTHLPEENTPGPKTTTTATEVPTQSQLPISSQGIGGLPSAPSINNPIRYSVPKATKEQIEQTEGIKSNEPEIESTTQAGIPKFQSSSKKQETGQVETDSSSTSQTKINIPSIKSSVSDMGKSVQNIASPAGPFVKLNSGRVAEGLKSMTQDLGRGIFGIAKGGTAGAYKAGVKIGNGGINAFVRGSHQVSAGGTRLTASSTSKKVGLVLIGFLLLTALFSGFTGGITGPVPGAEAGPIGGSGCPDTSSNKAESTCRYLNPSIDIFNTSLPKSAFDTYISKYSPIFIGAGKGDLAEFTKRANYIVTSAQNAGLNPAIFLGYWRSESNFSTVVDPGSPRDMGCLGDNFYEQVDCALGINQFQDPEKNPIANCARSKDTNSVACAALKDVRKNFDKTHPISYPIATFDDFAESYGPYDDLSGGLHTNCTHTYNILVDISKELGSCVASGSAPLPPPSGDLKQAIFQRYIIDLDSSFDEKHLLWTWQIMAYAEVSAPKFLPLLKEKYSEIKLRVWSGVGQRSGNTILFSNAPGSFFSVGGEKEFQQILIHELAHIIHGTRGDDKYTVQIENAVAGDKDFLTGYAQGSTAADIVCPGKDSGERAVQLDEDFAEAVAYYINKDTPELNYSDLCPPKNSQNPYQTGKYPNHQKFMRELLGGSF